MKIIRKLNLFYHFVFQLNFVTKNKTYLLDILLTAAIEKFERVSDHKSVLLVDLQQQLRGPPKPKPRNLYKTDVI